MKFARAALALLMAVVLCGAAVAKETGSKDSVKANSSRVAYGVYMHGKKVGWVVRESKLGRFKGRDAIVKTEESFMTFLVAGNPYRMTTIEKTVYALEGNGPVEYFEKTETLNNAKPVKTTGRRKGTMLVIAASPDGRSHTRTVPLPKSTLQQNTRLVAWLRSPRKAGDTFEMHDVAVEERTANKQSTMTFVKSDSMSVNGVATKVVHVSVKSNAGRMALVMATNGDQIRVAIGKIVIQREDESQAKTGIVAVDPGFDIRVDKNIGPAPLVDRLTIEVRGLKRGEFPTSHRQRILGEKNGVITLELLRDFRDATVLHPLTESQRKAALESTTEIQSDDPKIQVLARKIIGQESDPVKQAGLLQEWVFRNLKKTYAISATTSLRVLENKAGKCTDHALLFVALARAVKLPAREVFGAMFVANPKRPNFGLHAWAEIHDGQRWVTIDPMVCEVFVDGAHFRFSTDDSKTPVSTMFSGLTISIVRAETRAALLTAFGAAGASHIIASNRNLKLLFRAVEKKLLTVEELNTEVQRTLQLIDLNLQQMTALAGTNLSYVDRKTVVTFIAVYRTQKQQAAALKAFAEKRGDGERKAFEQAAATAKKLFQGIGA